VEHIYVHRRCCIVAQKIRLERSSNLWRACLLSDQGSWVGIPSKAEFVLVSSFQLRW